MFRVSYVTGGGYGFFCSSSIKTNRIRLIVMTVRYRDLRSGLNSCLFSTLHGTTLHSPVVVSPPSRQNLFIGRAPGNPGPSSRAWIVTGRKGQETEMKRERAK